MKKSVLFLIFGLILAMPFIAAQEEGHDEYSENGWTIAAHTIETIAIVIMVVFALMAAGMFAQGLGKGMKILAWGLVLLGFNTVIEGLHHFNITVIPIAEGSPYHGLVHHIFGTAGVVFMAFGFWTIYNVAKGVASDSSKKKSK